MEKYVNTEYHFVRNSGGLSGKELAKLSDDELAEYLKQDSILQEKKKYRINPDFILREIAGEAVLIPVGEAGIFENSLISLNDTCSFLWKLFQTPRTAEDVIAQAKEEYEDPEGEMEQGIYSFIEDYVKYGLLKEE